MSYEVAKKKSAFKLIWNLNYSMRFYRTFPIVLPTIYHVFLTFSKSKSALTFGVGHDPMPTLDTAATAERPKRMIWAHIMFYVAFTVVEGLYISTAYSKLFSALSERRTTGVVLSFRFGCFFTGGNTDIWMREKSHISVLIIPLVINSFSYLLRFRFFRYIFNILNGYSILLMTDWGNGEFLLKKYDPLFQKKNVIRTPRRKLA